MFDDFGDRMKQIERVETAARFDPELPVYARIDGRGFSKFTRGMNRPYDERMSAAMIRTTKMLVERTNARIGYTQSDEISLLYANDPSAIDTQFIFDGKKQKMVSVLASLATACFTRAILDTPDFADFANRLPHFDARVFSLPSQMEAANAILWREQDATKNAISMAAYAVFSHNSLQNKTSRDKIAMMEAAGINFSSYPAFFRQGTFVRRETEVRTLTEAERLAIPERNRPAPDFKVTRSRVVDIDMPKFSKVSNRVDVVLNGAMPIVAVEELQD